MGERPSTDSLGAGEAMTRIVFPGLGNWGIHLEWQTASSSASPSTATDTTPRDPLESALFVFKVHRLVLLLPRSLSVNSC